VQAARRLRLTRRHAAARAHHAAAFALELRVAALCDSRGCVELKADASREEEEAALREVLAWKKGGAGLDKHPRGRAVGGDFAGFARALVERVAAPVVAVDCTATDATTPALLRALALGGCAVMANKRPVAGSQRDFDEFAAAAAFPRVGISATVGAGTPYVATMRRLRAANDAVRRVAGTFSGTLGFLCTELEGGRAFSEAVREAHRLGYTEPDPRDDLGGMDVARKALILARLSGRRLEMADVEVEGLYPARMAALSVPAFLDALPQLDADFAARVAEAQARGETLRFAATVAEGERVRVGLTRVPRDSPLGRLRGTQNLAEITSRVYQSPLVVQGSGAGADITAAGVLADVVEVALQAVARKA
jgi:homoserine dehydrogenase